MGRPLNKRHFGEPRAGNQIKVQFATGGTEYNGHIIRQLGSKRFECGHSSDGLAVDVTAICTLVTTATGSLADGEMNIHVKKDDTTIVRVAKISGRKLTDSDGNAHAWTYSSSTGDGKVEMEEAGSNLARNSADNFDGA